MKPGMGHGMVKHVQRSNDFKGTILRLVHYMKEDRLMIMIVTIAIVISSLLDVIAPYIMGVAIDEYLIVQHLDGFWIPITILLGSYLGSAFLVWLTSYLMAGISQATVMRIRKALFQKLQRLPVRFFDHNSDGDLVSRLTNDIDNISNSLNQSLTQLIGSIVIFFSVLGIMVAMDLKLTIVALLSLPVVVAFTKILARYTRKRFKEQMIDLGNLNGFTEEIVSGQKVVIAYGEEQNTIKHFDQKNQRYKQSAIKAEVLTSIMGPVMNFFNNMIYAIVALVGALMVVHGMTTVGVVVAFISYARWLFRPVTQVANLYNTIQSAIAGAERVFEVMDQQEERFDGVTHEISGDVAFKGVYFAYDNDKPILKEISITANKGDMVAIVGPSGAGKTTIINLLTRFYDIDQGAILIDGNPINTTHLDHLRAQLGIVLQDTYLFTGTVIDNIKYGNPDATDEAVIEASKLSNADQFIIRLPESYNTMITGEGSDLSQGQRQLIAIARAILADPKILILDEATSSVDTRTELLLQKGLHHLMAGRTTFVIAHKLSTIRAADKIYVIDDGRVIEEGNHDQLMIYKGHYHEMYLTQFEVS